MTDLILIVAYLVTGGNGRRRGQRKIRQELLGDASLSDNLTGVFVFFTLSRVLFSRRHPARPVSVLIIHPGTTQGRKTTTQRYYIVHRNAAKGVDRAQCRRFCRPCSRLPP